MRRGRRLTGEDERLWATVARQAVPLKGKRHPSPPVPDAPEAAATKLPGRSAVKAIARPDASKNTKTAGAGQKAGRGGNAGTTGIGATEGPAGPSHDASAEFRAALAGHGGLPTAPSLPVRRQTQHPIERPTRRKIARGRIAIEARLDLHEMTQGIAHDQLVRFLRQAQAMGIRHVLVITGRGGGAFAAGFGSRGILRRVVPLWFSGPEFRPLVSGFESAERHHGGDGAFYVRVRRLR